MPPIDRSAEPKPPTTDIEITAYANRRTLEALYLELRELAKQRGLKIKYQMTTGKPGDRPHS
jgi:hypothetical protein